MPCLDWFDFNPSPLDITSALQNRSPTWLLALMESEGRLPNRVIVFEALAAFLVGIRGCGFHSRRTDRQVQNGLVHKGFFQA